MMESKHYDIIVIGGGFAGTAAAIAAARQGRRVRLIEKYNCLGGAAAFDLVNPFMRYWDYTEGRREKIMLSRGIFTEMLDRIEAEGGFRAGSRQAFNEEILKLVLNRMAIESGVSLLFGTVLVGAERDGNAIRSITVSNVSGTYQMSADRYIDATGDANLAMLAGFDYRVGRESDGLCQPMTLCFRVGNVDRDRFYASQPRWSKIHAQKLEAGQLINPRENILVFHTPIPNVLHFNTTRVVKKDPTCPEDVTEAEVLARQQVQEVYELLKEHADGLENSYLMMTAAEIGVRESRMIVGDYVLTETDCKDCTRFEDAIAASNYEIDIHNPEGTGTSHYFFKPGEYYTIPYRCLLPRELDNLLVAGRCISATHEAQASVRIMPICAISACWRTAIRVSRSVICPAGKRFRYSTVEILFCISRLSKV